MARRNFRQVLIQIAAPRLRELGYAWDENLRDRNLMYGFSKQLAQGIEAQITFQRHQHEERAEGLSFTVGLHRRVDVGADSAPPAREVSLLDMRLPTVMWFIYGLRLTQFPDYWWNPLNEGQLVTTLDDVLAKLEAYGIPWLEGANSHMPGWLPDEAVAEFLESLTRVAAAVLVPRGYRPGEMLPRMRQAAWYVHPLSGDLKAFIAFGVEAKLERSGKAFRIVLVRTRNTWPNYDPLEPGGLSFHFGSLLAYLDGWLDDYPRGDRQVRGQYPYMEWGYESPEELDAQLIHACALLEKIGLPWIEDPASTIDLHKQAARLSRYEQYAPLRSAARDRAKAD